MNPEFEAVILRCLEKNPANRFASGSELATALESLELPGWSLDEARRWWQPHWPVEGQLEDREAEKGPHLEVDIDARTD